MENPEEILHSLEEFTKTKPKDIPRELEEYLCFVAKTGDPVYQWSAIKSLFREKMINVITEFYETCPSVEIPPCPNVDLFNYDIMKNFILEKLDTFAAAPFTLQRICELLTTPRKEYNRIDKYMRALEKNILVVSTTEPGGRRNTENGEGIMNGLESEHLPETSNSSNDINVEEMDDTPSWPRLLQNETVSYQNDSSTNDTQAQQASQVVQETVVTASKIPDVACTSSQDTVITCRSSEEPYVSIEPVPSNTCARQDNPDEADVSVTITAIPAGVQKRRNSVEPVVSSESTEEITESSTHDNSDKINDETSKETDSESEQKTSSSQQIEDADSSSSHEGDEESTESKSEATVDTSSLSISADEDNLSSTEEENKATSEACTSEATQGDENVELEENKSEIVEGSEEVTVDTTKCSHLSPLEPCEEQSKDSSEDPEISSSDKVNNEVHSSESELIEETEAKVDESSNEPNSSSEEVVSDRIEESHVDHVEVEKVDEKEDSVTPMEVDEDCSNSERVEEVVRAEATSDSPL
ncbi:serine/threonine-protein phosphatase 4 regulatory subunit 2 [Asbolus verrucosus]|uniref:Serine/threonine-protein phosphatase 4 regulatory subunit 2 n=1 Tax=Asbolus verrucosus TaxID=1661398 RepID=A0A482VCS8_ASBVE|nr:serine/threonine-protein phosphatase 4 regulatory subunit 2 [Asbolus verrucosus]